MIHPTFPLPDNGLLLLRPAGPLTVLVPSTFPSSLPTFAHYSGSCDFRGSISRSWKLEFLDHSKAWQVGELAYQPCPAVWPGTC